jgi:hypothetical protein
VRALDRVSGLRACLKVSSMLRYFCDLVWLMQQAGKQMSTSS